MSTRRIDRSIRLCIAQIATIPGQGDHNISKMCKFIKCAKALGADVICFHELTICDYTNIEEWSETIPGGTTNKIREKARQVGIGVIFGLPEIDNGKLFNSAIMIDPEGKLIGKYRKTHLSLDSRGGKIPREVDIFSPGKELPVFDTWLGKVGIMICKDGLFPEVARILSIKGVEIIFWLNSRGKLSRANLESIANLNRVTLCASNRAEVEEVKGGGSAIVQFEVSHTSASDSFPHQGSFISCAGTSETLLFGTVNLAVIRKERKAWLDHWLNRQPEIYEALVFQRKISVK